MVSNTKEYSIAYYHAKQRATYTCECKHIVKLYNKYRHIKTNKHIRYLNTLPKEEILIEVPKEEIEEVCKVCETA